MATARLQTIEEIAAAANKEFGDNTVIIGKDAKREIPRTHTGSLSIDLATGGGLPTNQWTEVVGPESSGKTALCYMFLAAEQKANPDHTALWVAAEEYVPSYAAMFGVDDSRLWVIETNEMEPALNTVLKAIENRAVDMVVIDSLPALVTATELGKDIGQASVATGAQIFSQFFKKSTKAQRRSLVEGEDDRPCTMIAINQWRDQIGVMFGDPRTTPGGKAKNYYFFLRIDVRRDDWITEGSAIENRVGQVIKIRTMKNKTYRSNQVAAVDFYFANTKSGVYKAGSFDTIKDMVNVCIMLEVIQQGGSYYKFDGQQWQGKEKTYAAVREDLGLQKKLQEAAFEIVLNQGKAALPSEGEEEGWLPEEDEAE